MLKEAFKITQLSLGEGFEVPDQVLIPRVDFRQFSEDDLAATVLSKFFNSLSIEKFSYTEYNPLSVYPEDPLMSNQKQPFVWQEWVSISEVEKISRNIFEESLHTKILEGEVGYISNIMAIASKVKVRDNNLRHIPMLDFEFSLLSKEDAIGIIEEMSLPPGLLLETDVSYHYYGFELMEENTWRKWMNDLTFIKNSEYLFGNTFLDYCLERGYSALRTFGYPGTMKEKSPKVVSKV